MGKSNPKYSWRDILRQNAPKRPAHERVSDFAEIYSLHDEAAIREQANRCIQCPEPLCVTGCPLSNRIPEWIRLTAEGKFLEAAEISRSTSNMPEICSRVCPQERLCEGACILNACSDPITIGAIEKFINEYAFAHGDVTVARAQPNGLSVAVIGAGPGGLACADELAKLGYAVTVFESQSLPGGLLMSGIPAFKLEKNLVDRRVALLREMGVTFRFKTAVGRHISIEQLREQFEAVFLSMGAQKPKPLDSPGADLSGIFDALPFLAEKNVPELQRCSIPVEGKRVVVLGGGDTAMDCLRTAVRSGAMEAVCIYRRDLANMPGSKKEYLNALEEGARFLFLTVPVAVTGENGFVTEVRCARMELGEPDAGGRRKPRQVPGSEFSIRADVVLVAYGFDAFSVTTRNSATEIAVNEWGTIVVDDNQMTSLAGVFAGGDLSRGPSLVVHAVRDGRKAASGIHTYLRGQEKRHALLDACAT
ncbi:MAG: NAD(P)-dependent oxidoreductase [Verrucomicrobia bacterium]|nr:NAD(P)-dependent oxidoreductase [Verrucomicrobiota bacterium]